MQVQLLRQRFEQQSHIGPSPPRSWPQPPADVTHVDVSALRFRLFAEPDSRGRACKFSSDSEHSSESAAHPSTTTQHVTTSGQEYCHSNHHVPYFLRDDEQEAPALEDRNAVDSTYQDHHPEGTERVTEAELSKLANTLRALGLGSDSGGGSAYWA